MPMTLSYLESMDAQRAVVPPRPWRRTVTAPRMGRGLLAALRSLGRFAPHGMARLEPVAGHDADDADRRVAECLSSSLIRL